MATSLGLKVFLVIVYLAPNAEPQMARGEMPDLKTCWAKAAQLLDGVNKQKDHPIGVKYGVGCMMSAD